MDPPQASPGIEITPEGQMHVLARAPALERWSWALYDFANTIFSMNIATLYFAVWIVTERGASNTAFSLATSLSSAVVLVAAPYFGALSDASRRRKPWVVGFTLACAAATAVLAPLASAPLFLPLLAFALANTAYQMALPFYNAMLPELVPESERGRLSGYGTAAGYVGSIAGVLSVAPLVSAGGRQSTFLPTAILFLLFSLPLILFCRDHLPRPRSKRPRVRFRDIVTGAADAFRAARRHPGLVRLIFASYFYQDALGTTIAFMAIFAVSVLSLPVGGEVTLFAVLTVPAVLGSFATGFVSDRIGPRRTLLLILWGWVIGLVSISLAPSLTAFWVCGVLLGLVFGGIWTAERPLLLTLVPEAEAGRFFGLLTLSARAAAIVGPLLWALLVDGLAGRLGKETAYRLAVGSLALFMAAAIWLLRGVPERGLPSAPRSK